MDITTGQWIGYQILGGVAWGSAFQIPIVIGQSNATASDLPSITAIILFSMNLGCTTLLTATQRVFVNKLIEVLPKTAPSVDPLAVVATGATELRNAFAVE